jgi:hypothetical protein
VLRLYSCLVAGLIAISGISPVHARSLTHDAPADRGPRIQLDRLELLPSIAQNRELKAHLTRVLRRETRRADWGVGHGGSIRYRFTVRELSLNEEGDVLHVTCSAFGTLPKGRTAKSRISFGGAPADKNRIVKHVLEIVARGVVTRLSALERERRTRIRS